MARKSKVKPDYGEGYCDGWMQCLERMANLASLDGQANEMYHGLWLHWEHELLPWQQGGTSATTPPVFRPGSPVSYPAVSLEGRYAPSQTLGKDLASVCIEHKRKVEP